MKEHEQQCENILRGKCIPELENDPLLSKEAEFNVDLKQDMEKRK